MALVVRERPLIAFIGLERGPGAVIAGGKIATVEAIPIGVYLNIFSAFPCLGRNRDPGEGPSCAARRTLSADYLNPDGEGAQTYEHQ